LALFFPGIVLVQWLGEDLLGYKEMTVTDGCLVMVIILLSVVIVNGINRRSQSRRSSPAQSPSSGSSAQPYPDELPQRGLRRPTRKTSSRRSTRRQ